MQVSREKSEKRACRSDYRDKFADFLIAQFEADMRKNTVEYGAALLYVGYTIYSYLYGLVERDLGLILILSSVIILLYVLGERRRIKEKYFRKLRYLYMREHFW